MDSSKVVENIYLLVIVTLISVLQNGENKQNKPQVTVTSAVVFKNSGWVGFDLSVSVFEVFFAQKVERECKSHKTNTSAFERVSCAK